MLKVILPETFVHSSINMVVNAITVGFVVHPFSLVHVSIDVSEFSESMSTIVFPVAFVASSVWPDLFAVAISEATDPLASIRSPSLVSVGGSLLPLRIWIVFRIVRDSFTQLNLGEVTTVRSLGLLDHRNLLTGSVTTPQRLKSDNEVDVLLELPQVRPSTWVFLPSEGSWSLYN